MREIQGVIMLIFTPMAVFEIAARDGRYEEGCSVPTMMAFG